MVKKIKKIRIFISIVFLISTTLLFVDINQFIPTSAFSSVLYLQFIPSIMKFIGLVSVSAIGFILIIVTTVLIGRIYCSAICPLGIFIDFILFLKKKFLKRKKKRLKYKFTPAPNKTRYTILGLTIISVFSGSMILVNILDPFSNYGRIVNTAIRPLIIGVNNIVAFTLEKFDSYILAPFPLKGLPFFIVILSGLFLIFIIVISVMRGRLYCNSICPVGALLGLISKFSIFKITVNENTCIECGGCEKVCKSNCIDSAAKEIDFTRCVLCLDCFESCPTKGLQFSPVKFGVNRDVIPASKEVESESRRKLLGMTALLVGVKPVLSLAQGINSNGKELVIKVKNKIPIPREYPTTPPGSVSIDHFTSSCTSCYLCVSACPSQVLQPALLQYGHRGVLMPHMNYKNAYCNYNCVKCTEVCPSGAINPIKIEEKKTIQMGKVNFIKDNCIVITNKTECGACSEHCPTKAVTMIEENGLRVPLVKEEICIGCGACEYACPAIPHKAIYVEGNIVHAVAQIPKSEALEAVDLEEEFPF